MDVVEVTNATIVYIETHHALMSVILVVLILAIIYYCIIAPIKCLISPITVPLKCCRRCCCS